MNTTRHQRFWVGALCLLGNVGLGVAHYMTKSATWDKQELILQGMLLVTALLLMGGVKFAELRDGILSFLGKKSGT